MKTLAPPNIVDLLLDAICIVKADSSIVYVSPAFERIFGYAPEEVIGRRMLDMVHPEDRTPQRPMPAFHPVCRNFLSLR